MVAAILGKILEPAMPKRSNDSYLKENQEPKITCFLSTTFQIDVANKQLVPPPNRNNLFSKTY